MKENKRKDLLEHLLGEPKPFDETLLGEAMDVLAKPFVKKKKKRHPRYIVDTVRKTRKKVD